MRLLIADTWIARAGGLLTQPKLEDQEFLWLKPCRSIHTFGMRYAIAVFFIDRHGRVINLIPELKPCRVAYERRAYSVVESLPIIEAQRDTIVAQLERELSSSGGGRSGSI